MCLSILSIPCKEIILFGDLLQIKPIEDKRLVTVTKKKNMFDIVTNVEI